jgi:hypothetical protein
MGTEFGSMVCAVEEATRRAATVTRIDIECIVELIM